MPPQTGNGALPPLLARAQDLWVSRLIDLSRRNNLLYYRPLKLGTLELGRTDPQALFRLVAGSQVSLARLLPASALMEVDDGAALADPDAVPESRIGAVRKLNEIARKATENREERGLDTMYLAYGMATWTAEDGGRDAVAPVLLVPVRQAGRDRLAPSLGRSGDLEVNLALLHILEEHFHCGDVDSRVTAILGDLDTEDGTAEATANEILDCVRQAASRVPGFAISTDAVLGNFSFQKLAMVRDLQRQTGRLATNPIVAAMAGDMDARVALQAQDDGDDDPASLDLRSPDDEFSVLTADSSQQLVIARAVSGRSGVIVGPPGTGKSQTIANIMAEMAARGKSVLFVAEKRAALEAVRKRLTQVGLDHLTLDLHGAVTKKEVARQFGEALNIIGSTPPVDATATHAEYMQRRTVLNNHAARLHQPVGTSGLSVFFLQGSLLRADVQLASAVRWNGSELQGLAGDQIPAVAALFDEGAGVADLLLGTSASPWARAAVTDQATSERALALVRRLRSELLPALGQAVAAVVAATGLPWPAVTSDIRVLSGLANDAQRLGEAYRPELWSLDLAPTAAALRPGLKGGAGAVWAGWCNGAFKRARQSMLAVRTAPASAATLAGEAESAATLAARWAQASPGGTPVGTTLAPTLARQWETAAGCLAELAGLIPGTDPLNARPHDLDPWLGTLLADTLTPYQLPKAYDLARRMSQIGLWPIVEEFRRRHASPSSWMPVFLHAWWSSWLDAARAADPDLAAFDGSAHGRVVARFCELDLTRTELALQRVRRAHAERAVAVMNEYQEETQHVRRQAGLKTRHWPLRRLVTEAGPVLTALKPCWMASPLSVSQLLDDSRDYFDLVVFDEASQVLPEDAVTSLLRGRAGIVAGDPRQLPPTTFFAAGGSDEGEPSTDDSDATAGFESVLDILATVFRPWDLEWHYRSLDERLIAFSNEYIYNRSLLTFPGPALTSPVRHVLVDATLGDADEESVTAEVEAVARLVAEHAVTCARNGVHRSLGVITMGIKHARRIEATLDVLRRTDGDLEAFLGVEGADGFFVKNLERVQGDERDCVILSIGYGKDLSGRLPYRFGPLLYAGGERRLNVAITRACREMTLVSSFGYQDMDPSRSTGRGVQLLRAYLEYMAGGGMSLVHEGVGAVESNGFELDVAAALRERGLDTIAQYGASSYRIDLVATHPARPGAFVLAIECDGATYHSAPTARDRDRLRQERLEALGWRFCRIWSTDWFHRRAQEIERVVDAYERAVAVFDQRAAGGAEPERLRIVPSAAAHPAALTRGPRPPVPIGDTIDDFTQRDIERIVVWLLGDGLVRTDDVLVREVMDELGFEKLGRRIHDAISLAIAHVRAQRTA